MEILQKIIICYMTPGIAGYIVNHLIVINTRQVISCLKIKNKKQNTGAKIPLT